VKRLSDETVRIIAMPDTRERFLKQGANPSAAGSAAFGQLHKHEYEYARLSKVVQESDITPQ
jgi:hypothetical protein